MTYAEALQAAKDGALVKRPHWDNPLRYACGRLEFVTAVACFGKTLDRSYEPVEIESAADDWVLV